MVLTSVYNANSQRTSLAATRSGTNDFLNSYGYGGEKEGQTGQGDKDI